MPKMIGVNMGNPRNIYDGRYDVWKQLTCTYSIYKENIKDLCNALGMNDNRMKLEIASGTRPHKGYIHLEYDEKKPDVDIKADARMMPFKDETFDEILCIHFLEHMYLGSIPLTLSEINRILKIGGILNIEVPDFDFAKKRPVNQTSLVYEALYMNNRGDGDIGNQDEFIVGFNHCSCFNYDILSTFLICAGFEVKRNKEMEDGSCHKWIGVVAARAIKVGVPHPSKYWNDKLGRETIQNNFWNKEFKNRYR